MAAVAGSKGRLEFAGSTERSFQMSVVDRLLSGEWSSGQGAEALMRNAAVREVGIDTNMVCNLRCQYCYLDDRPEAKGTVPLNDLKSHLGALAASGVKLFAFIGKEPLADGRAVEVLTALNQLRHDQANFRTGMVTNGTLIERWLDQLVDADLSYLDISIDGLGDAENRLRGSGVAERIRSGVTAVTRSPLRNRFATATVLTDASLDGYPEFVAEMFDSGVITCFASPVLRFAMSNEVADYAVSLEETWRLAESLAKRHADDEGRQIILDLPYRYTWALLTSGRVKASAVQEDAYEALYWRLEGSNVYLKLNPFSFAYWRALRITHDGKTILNMDLAAHANYGEAAPDFREIDATIFEQTEAIGRPFLDGFIARHLEAGAAPVFERDLAAQYARHRGLKTAA